MKSKFNLQTIFVFLLAFFLPFVLVLLYPNHYHKADIPDFLRWSHHWNENWKDIYLTCSTCNYPIIGLFSSAGILFFLDAGNEQNTITSFRLFLSLVDGINIILLFWLLKHFSVKRASIWAGIIGILPSSYIGSSLWGQIDGIAQMFILVSLLWIILIPTQFVSSPHKVLFYLFIAVLLLSFLTLTKQLAIFSLFPLIFMLVVNLIFVAQKRKTIFMGLFIIFLTFFSSILFWDFLLNIPSSYWSHLQYIWATGSEHGKVISGNGFNLWIFFFSKTYAPSTTSFITNTDFLIAKLFSPYVLGILFFFGYNLILLFSLTLFFREQWTRKKQWLDDRAQLNLILYLALANLSFNVFLTGTHERYLYHFYPLVILAYLGLKKHNKIFSNLILAILLFGASLYGLFVYKVLLWEPNSLYQYLATFHLVLLFMLTFLAFKKQHFKQNISNLWKLMTF